MVAVRVTRAQRAAIVAAPSFFDSYPKPKRRACTDPSMYPLPTWLCWRLPRGFDKGRRSLSVAVNGLLTVDDADVLIRAAVDGVGLAFRSTSRRSWPAAHSFRWSTTGASRLLGIYCNTRAAVSNRRCQRSSKLFGSREREPMTTSVPDQELLVLENRPFARLRGKPVAEIVQCGEPAP